MSLSNKPSNILGAGLKKWQVRATDASTAAQDVAYYTLPYPYEGKFIDKTLVQGDAAARQVAHAFDFAYEAKFMVTDKTSLIKMIPALVRNPTDHIITFQNGRTNASAFLHSQHLGLNFKLVIEGDVEGVRYLQLMADRKVVAQPIVLAGTVQITTGDATVVGTGTKFLTALRAGDILSTTNETHPIIIVSSVTDDTHFEATSVLTDDESGITLSINEWKNFLYATVPADGTPTVSDILYALNSLTRSMIYPGGVRRIWVREKSSGGWTHEFGKVNKFSLTVEGLGERDQEGRTQTNRAKFDLSFNMMQSSQTEELVDLQTIANQENDFRIEFVDGMMLTLDDPSNLGIEFELHNDQDGTGNQFIAVKGSGIVSLLGSTFANLWS